MPLKTGRRLKIVKSHQKRRSARINEKATRELTVNFGRLSLKTEDFEQTRLEIRAVDADSNGVYAVTDIAAGEIIAEYRGKMLFGRQNIEETFQSAEAQGAKHFYKVFQKKI